MRGAGFWVSRGGGRERGWERMSGGERVECIDNQQVTGERENIDNQPVTGERERMRT